MLHGLPRLTLATNSQVTKAYPDTFGSRRKSERRLWVCHLPLYLTFLNPTFVWLSAVDSRLRLTAVAYRGEGLVRPFVSSQLRSLCRGQHTQKQGALREGLAGGVLSAIRRFYLSLLGTWINSIFRKFRNIVFLSGSNKESGSPKGIHPFQHT